MDKEKKQDKGLDLAVEQWFELALAMIEYKQQMKIKKYGKQN